MGRTAIVVDDSKSARFALRKILEGAGYEVQAFEMPDAAIAALAAQRPDVMFLDHLMPGVEGFDVLRQIKSDPRTVTLPVVMCSSHEGEDFTLQARSRGAADVLHKPPNPEQLRAVLARIEQVADALRPARSPAAGAPAATRPAQVPTPSTPEVAETPAVAAAPNTPVTATPVAKVQPIRAPEAAIEQRVMQSLRDALVPAADGGGDAERPVQSREAMDSRLRKMTQDFYAQIAEIKAHLASLDDAFTDPDRLREMIREEVRTALAGLRDELLQAARAEAQAESERTVMNAAGRIADQMSQSLLKSLPAGSVTIKR
ncbi:MAG TPA: response regulator [Candidatus Binatia bacterium]|nr:response regulator [Candidatus Binatia bacterium]